VFGGDGNAGLRVHHGEVIGDGDWEPILDCGTYDRIVEIGEVVHYEGGVEAVTRRDEWTSVAVQRGFDALCTEFLDAVRSGRTLDPADALETHLLCERIVAEVEGKAS